MRSLYFIKHYEKIILVVTLVLLVLSLMWLIDIFYSISKAKASTVVVTADKVAYKRIRDNNSYDSFAAFQDTKLWQKSEKRNTSPETPDYILTFTDLMIPFKIARSNAPGANNQLIPYAYYKVGTCPISNEKISLEREAIINKDSLDTDKDSIPDAIEKKFNMNPKDPRDIYEDIDDDSFSNIQEYRYNREGISDKAKHPPLIERLLLVKVSNTRIPLILKKIIRHDGNKEDWNIQVNVKLTGNRWTTKFLKLGDSIEINEMEYRVKDVQYKTENALDPRLGVIVERDISSIVLLNSMNEKIIAQKNRQIYEPNRKITLKDLYTGKITLARVGNTITLGDENIGTEEYKIVNIVNNNSIEFEKNGEIFVVGKKTNYKPPVESTILSDEPSQTQKEEKLNAAETKKQ